MGTRALTFVYDGNDKIINLYRQFDGYPSGHGVELAEFLNSGEMVNGLSLDEKEIVFNGAGDLAAQLVAHFKEEPGGFYLYPVTSEDCGQDFEYHVYVNDNDISIKVMDCGFNMFGMTQDETYEPLFEGDLKQFAKFCSGEEIFEDSIVSREVLKKQLHEGVVSVVFTKKDGTERTMKATLSEDYIPLFDTTGVTVTKTKAPNPDVLAVWDLEANGWRSFRFDSVKQVEINV